MNSPFLIAGLGNPGDQYARTRHNIGFRVIDELVARWAAPAGESKFRSEFYSLFEVRGVTHEKVFLQKPQTYMNLSGQAVRPAVQFYKIPPESNVIAIFDEVDLPPGQIRIRKTGSAGGHNGVKSLIQELGTKDFIRLRIGVGRSNRPTDAHVLGKIPKAENALYEEAIYQAAQAVEAIIRDGVTKAMTEFNQSIEKSEKSQKRTTDEP